jgi:anti-anti-sigma factor
MHLTHERVHGDCSSESDTLVVRWERRQTVSIVWLTGALDRTTAPVLEGELDARAIGTIRLVVDLTGLELIDPSGLDALVRLHRRAPERGERLSFRHGQHVAQRPRGLIRAVQLRSEWAPRPERLSDDDSYFALAMACVDVDHARPGDRPRAA